MYTVIETPLYTRKIAGILTEEERENFSVFISENPNIGDVIKGTGGVRKIRWAISNKGKSGGSRIIYFNQLANGQIYLLTIYVKNESENIPAHVLKLMKEGVISNDKEKN